MKFFFMHLMPFADLDLDYDKTYNTTWVTFPNSYYDPQKGVKLYNRYIDELVYADELGFDGVSVNEHHQNAYGLMPIPGVIAGALVRQTKRCKVAVLGRALPLVNNPLNIAEEYAMLDNISGGRLIAGFVRGIGAEYHSTGVNPAESHGRFQEVQTVQWAAHPSRKYAYLQTFSPIEQLARFMKMYRDQAEAYGYTAPPQQLGWATPIYVAETDEIAKCEAKPHIEAFYNKFLKMPREMLIPPGYVSLASSKVLATKAKAAVTANTAQTIDDVMGKGMFLCGSPHTIAQQLETYQQQVGFGQLIALMQFGTLPHDLTLKNLELFARKVIPRVRHLGESPAQAAATVAAE